MAGITYGTLIPTTFSKKELSQLFFTVFAFSLVFLLVKWRTTDFTMTTGIMYFVFALIVSFLFTYIAVLVQKKWGGRNGYEVEYQNSMLFLFIGVLVTFLFLGFVFVLSTGEAVLKLNPRYRLGQFRTHIHLYDAGLVSMAPAFLGLASYIVLMILYAATKSEFVLEAVKIILLISLFILMPAPKNNGITAFRWNKLFLLITFIVLATLFFITFLSEPLLTVGMLVGGLFLIFIAAMDVLPRIFYGA